MDATQLHTHLWQGSAPRSLSELQYHGFDTLVLAAIEIQPADHLLPGINIIRVRLVDDGTLTQPMWRDAMAAAERVVRRVRANHKVLVTCAAGRNRSGLVSALALSKLMGCSACQAAEHVRSRREHALTNRAFSEALCRYLPRGAERASSLYGIGVK